MERLDPGRSRMGVLVHTQVPSNLNTFTNAHITAWIIISISRADF